ncbi:MAG: GNAT family N-acetyltransferase [Porticoccaceae bacterium]|nr:GNAT family N-acetyltransferase [Porticoccaceae bacterium]
MLTTYFALADELDYLQKFLVDQGTNQWNYLPEDGVKQQFKRLDVGADFCLVAKDGEDIIGMAIYCQPGDIPDLFDHYVDRNDVVYVAEVVVHAQWSGNGIGSTLLKQIAIKAKELGAHELIIDRHEQNLASAGMMEKAGFTELDCFADPKRRHAGSRKTSILSLSLNT